MIYYYFKSSIFDIDAQMALLFKNQRSILLQHCIILPSHGIEPELYLMFQFSALSSDLQDRKKADTMFRICL